MFVAGRGVENAVRPVTHPEDPQRVAVHRLHTFRQDILASVILGESPNREDLYHVLVSKVFAGFELPARHLVGHDPRGLDVCALGITLFSRLLVDLVKVHAEFLGQHRQLLPDFGVHLDAASIGAPELCQDLDHRVRARRCHASRHVRHGPAQHLQVAALVLPQEVRRLAMLQGLRHGFSFLVLRVPIEGLAARRLRVGRVLDARLPRETRYQVVGFCVELQARATLAVFSVCCLLLHTARIFLHSTRSNLRGRLRSHPNTN
mmetsp:Transcript_1784/g.4368  ORF Transcript_1784/g.4368 Transcript_1784/m.4368 type:complete len:262 (-) Transcript_1784:81-866(-)